MNQETNRIWTNLYDRCLGKDIVDLPVLAIRLFYFIDMTCYVLNGGAGGFLYKRSPTNTTDNYYRPYIDSLEYFSFHKTALLISEYNTRYHRVISRWERDKQISFDTYFNQEIPEKFCSALYSQIDIVVASEQLIHKWIDQNKDELKRVIDRGC